MGGSEQASMKDLVLEQGKNLAHVEKPDHFRASTAVAEVGTTTSSANEPRDATVVDRLQQAVEFAEVVRLFKLSQVCLLEKVFH